jgi:hypothetical protein
VSLEGAIEVGPHRERVKRRFRHKERPKREMCHTWDWREVGDEWVWVRRCDAEVQTKGEFKSDSRSHDLKECEKLGHWPCVVCAKLPPRT